MGYYSVTIHRSTTTGTLHASWRDRQTLCGLPDDHNMVRDDSAKLDNRSACRTCRKSVMHDNELTIAAVRRIARRNAMRRS